MKLKKDFPIFSQLEQGHPLCYLDSAAMSQKPQAVIDAVVRFYTTQNSNVGRGVYQLAEEATQLYNQARETVAQFISAQPHEIVFTKNSTEGINLVAAAWARETFKQGDEIILSELEHHSNIVPWQWVAQKTGAVIKYIPIDDVGVLPLDQLDELLTEKTKLVAVTQSSNAIGTDVDVEHIIKKAHASGAKVLIDACQTAPYYKLDMHSMQPDFLVFSGPKMLAPTGIGVLYIHEKMHNELEPFMHGGGMVHHADWHETSFMQSPHKFEAGSPPIAQAIGLGAAIDYLKKTISFDELEKQQAALCTQLIDGLAQFDRVRILGPIDQLKQKGHLVSFAVEGIHSHDVSAFLDTFGICVRSGNFCAQPLFTKLGLAGATRVSFYLYNDSEDVRRLLEGVEKLLQEL